MAPRFWTLLRKYFEYARHEKMSRGDLEALKRKKFRKLVTHAREHSPYYAQLMQVRGLEAATCRPEDFPELTKSILMENFDRLVTDPRIRKQAVADFLARSTDPLDLFLGEYHVNQTSGTTGDAGYFLFAKSEWESGRSQGMRLRTHWRTAPRRRRAWGRFRTAFYGWIDGHYAGVCSVSSNRRGLRPLFVNTRLLDVRRPVDEVAAELNAFQPDMIFGYTQSLLSLAARQRDGLLKISPRAVGTTGEGMTSSERSFLERAFGCPAWSVYGSSEFLTMGLTTPGRDSMTLYDDDLIYEFRPDHALITSLFNFTMPLIRYRLNDSLRPVAGPSSVMPYLEIEGVVARTELVPAFVDGEGKEAVLSPLSIANLFVAGVARIQLHWLSSSSFRFLVCPDASLSREAKDRAVEETRQLVQTTLNERNLSNVRFDVGVVDDLPVNPRTGKYNLIVDARG